MLTTYKGKDQKVIDLEIRKKLAVDLFIGISF